MDPRELVPVAEAEPLDAAHHHVVADAEVLDQDIEHARRHVGLDLQQRDRSAPELAQAAIHTLEQVVGVVVLDREIGIADDAEQVRAVHLRARKELVDVGAYHVFEEDEGVRPVAQALRQRHESRQDVGHLHARELDAPAVPHYHREVHAQVRDEREGVPGVERERGQNRADVAREVPVDVLVDLRSPRRRVEQPDLLALEQPSQGGPGGRQRVEHHVRARAHGLELLARGVAVGRHVLDAGAEAPHRRGHADHEELVEVGAGDGEELHPLEERLAGVLRLGEHALVELEPAELAVDVERRVLEIDRGHAVAVGRLRD